MYELYLFILKRNINGTVLIPSHLILISFFTALGSLAKRLPALTLFKRKFIKLEILYRVILYFTGGIIYLSLFCYCSISSLSLTLAVRLHYSNANQSHPILIETERQTTPIGLHISVLTALDSVQPPDPLGFQARCADWPGRQRTLNFALRQLLLTVFRGICNVCVCMIIGSDSSF